MRITTSITVDMVTGAVLDHQWFDYWGPVDLLKGDPTAQAEEKNTLAFQQQLQSIFSSQYASQTNTLNYLNNKMQAQVNNPQGYNAATLAAMRTSATDQNAAVANQAKMATQNQEFNQGGQNLPSGVNSQINASINTAAAEQQAGTQEGITQSNAALQNQNYWNATNVLSGVAAQYNPLGYSSGANQSGATGASLSEANTAAAGPGFGAILGSMAGGIGAMGAAGITKCYIASALYHGWNTQKTAFTRLWIMAKAPKWFSKFYAKYAERIAPTPLRYAFLPVFETVRFIYG